MLNMKCLFRLKAIDSVRIQCCSNICLHISQRQTLRNLKNAKDCGKESFDERLFCKCI